MMTESIEEDSAYQPLPHHEAMEQFRDAMAEIIVSDPLLHHLSTQVTAEEVQAQIALEHGQAITVNIRRADDIILPIVVLQNATVLDLKRSLGRFYKLKHQREDSGTMHISWCSIWRRYWLYFSGQKLTDDQRQLREYGISNKDEVQFIKRLRQK